MDTQRQDELAYEQTGDLYSHLQSQSIELAKLREENQRLRGVLLDITNLPCVSGAHLGHAMDIAQEVLDRLPKDWELREDKLERRAKAEALREFGRRMKNRTDGWNWADVLDDMLCKLEDGQ